MRILSWRKAALASGLAIAGLLPVPGLAQRELDELLTKADPRRGDWESERLQSDASDQLARLAEQLKAGKLEPQGLLEPDAKATALRPAEPARERLNGGIDVTKWQADSPGEPANEAADALAELLGPLRAAAAPRLKFKIVGVDTGVEGQFETLVRFEAVGTIGKRVVQQVARWRVSWVGSSDPPTIRSIGLESFQETARQGAMLIEQTAALLPPGAGWPERLAHGGDVWHGRIDALGELNLMGHQGIAVGDFDNDGREDLYVAMGTGLPNLLLIQQADGTLRDLAEQAGVAWLDDTKGVLFADMDNDGDQDLLMAVGPTIVLAKNDGKGKFDRYISMRAPTPASYYSLSVADYDLDGDLDIYGCRYVQIAYGTSVPMPFHDARNGPTNHLLRNDGEDRYADVTAAVGLDQNNSRFSLIGAWADYDDDGDPDLYVANDFGRNNLYRNDAGKFIDVAASAGAEDQAAGMGVSWADHDEDGDLDLHVTNMFSAAGRRVAYQSRFQPDAGKSAREAMQRHSLGNSLLANAGDGTFREVGAEAGVRMGRWGWGGKFADLNNDGREDLIVPNGFLSGAREDDL